MAGKNERGFAAMDPEQQREIARRGGRAAHESGNAHEFTSEEAAEAGRKGGEAVSKNREHMAEIGRKGGLAAHHRNAAFHHESAAHHHRRQPNTTMPATSKRGSGKVWKPTITAKQLMDIVKNHGDRQPQQSLKARANVDSRGSKKPTSQSPRQALDRTMEWKRI